MYSCNCSCNCSCNFNIHAEWKVCFHYSPRVSSGIPWYGIPPEFCRIFSRNSAGIWLRNSVFFMEFRIAEFRIPAEFRIFTESQPLWPSAAAAMSTKWHDPQWPCTPPPLQINTSDTEFRRNFSPNSVDTEFLRNSAGISYTPYHEFRKKNSAGIFLDGIMDTRLQTLHIIIRV